jgi:hypothetical protein
VPAHRLRHEQFGAHPVGACYQKAVVGLIAGARQVEGCPEATHVAVYAARAPCVSAEGLDGSHQRLPCCYVHARLLVRHLSSCMRHLQHVRGADAHSPHTDGVLSLGRPVDGTVDEHLQDLHQRCALQGLHLLLQGLRSFVGVADGAALLQYDGSGVHIVRDEVHRAARLLPPRSQHRLVHLKVHAAGEVRQQRGVHVDAAVPEVLHERCAHYAHVAYH